MTENIEGKMKTGIGIKSAIRRKLWLYVLGVLVLAVCVRLVLASAKKPRIYPPHQIGINCTTYNLMDRIEEAFSFYADWPVKDKRFGKKEIIEGNKKMLHKSHQLLERKLGPVEIRENETFDEATRVVVPILSETARNPSTGNLKVQPDQNLGDWLLEKQETPEGKLWRIIWPGDPNYAEIESTWLNLPRKKVPDSPTIILKRAVVIQVVSNGKVVSERTVFCDQWGGHEDRDEKESEPSSKENIEKNGIRQWVGTQREGTVRTVEDFFETSHDWKIAWSEYTKYLVGKKEYTLAVQKCDEALRKFPDDNDFVLQILNTKRIALERAKLYDEAIKCLKTWYEISKDDQTILPNGQRRDIAAKYLFEYGLGSYYEAQGKYEAAIKQYRKAAAMMTQKELERYVPRHRIGANLNKNVFVPMEIGNCYRKLGRYDLALQEYRKALKYAGRENSFDYYETEEENKKHGKNQQAFYLSKLSELITECQSKMKEKMESR